MRLVCPNCEAKYEVPEDAIPETGRDVQCANCGHAWYQMRPRAAVAEAVSAAPAVAPAPAKAAVKEAAPAPVAAPAAAPEPEVEAIEPELEVKAEASLPAEPAAAPEPDVEPAVEAVADAAPVTAAPVTAAPEVAAVEAAPVEAPVVADPAPEAVAEDQEEALAVAPAAAAAPAAYAVDESVLAILREEAEREAQARKTEAAKPLEVQADLGIDAAAPMKRKAVEVMAGAAGGHALAEDGDDRLAGRKARLPDVEEINSTLRPSEQLLDEGLDEPMAASGEGRSSFRSGFLLVLTLAIIGAALYISADALAEAVPALAGVLKSYVSTIDGLRLQLDGLMQSATVAINGGGT